MTRSERAVSIAAITLWALLECFNRLGAVPVYTTNEAREGVYVRAMLASGDFVAPTVANHLENGEVVPDKPPLFHWLAAAAGWARGQVDEWALRFPSALSAVVMVVAVATLGARLVGERAALIAAAALLTAFQFSFQARLGRVDMTFACWVTIATLLAGRAIVGGSRRALVLAGAAAGLAVLSKGPLGALLPALACGAFLLWRRERPPGLPWRTAIVALLAIALPWYVSSHFATGGATFRSQLVAENLDQFIGDNGRMRFFIYLEPWLLDSAPWSIVALFAVVEVWRRREAGPTFCAIAWLATVAFFQLAAYKRRAYLLPALPLEMLLVGWLIEGKLLAGRELAFIVEPRLFARGLAQASFIGALAGGAGLFLLSLFNESRLALAGLSPSDAAIGLGGAAIIGLSFLAVLRAARAGDAWRGLVAVFVALGSFYTAIYPAALEVFATRISPKPLIARIDREVPPGEPLRLCGIDDDPSLIVLFYFRDPDRVSLVRNDPTCRGNPPPGYYLISAGDWGRMRRQRENGDLWRERFGGQLKGTSAKSSVVFAEHRVGRFP